MQIVCSVYRETMIAFTFLSIHLIRSVIFGKNAINTDKLSYLRMSIHLICAATKVVIMALMRIQY